ncbi:MAG: hypothetical protein GY899_12860 [Verrucomicrobiaceae bacterium]|nr:hypothetical protein [Verrucomicrobiaceae bacterium]
MSSSSLDSAKALHADGLYQASKSLEAVTIDLEQLGALDKQSESDLSRLKGRKRAGCLTIGVLVGLGITALVLLGGNIVGFSVFLIVAGVAIGLPIIISANKGMESASKHEFPDYRYLPSLGLLRLLQADISPGANVDLRLNLKEKPESEVTQGKEKKTTWRKMVSTETVSTLRGRLEDGTKFDFCIAEEITSAGEYFPYRALSGKTKIKLRARKRIRWKSSLRLRFKEKRYSVEVSKKSNVESAIQLPEGASSKKVEIKPGEIKLSAVTQTLKFKHKDKQTRDIEGAWNAMAVCEQATGNLLTHLSAMMFLSLYQTLNSSQTKQPTS